MNQQTKQGEKNMQVVAVIFILGVLMIIGSVFIYSKAEDTAYDKLLAKYNENNAKIKELEGLLNSNISTAGSANVNAKDAKEQVEKKLAEFRSELDVFRDQCADTREKQIELRDALSKKRPQINIPTGPIVVEIVKGFPRGQPAAGKNQFPKQSPSPSVQPTTQPVGGTKTVPPDTKKKPLGKGLKSVLGEQSK